MSRNRSNHPADQSKNPPELENTRKRNTQSSGDLNKNEEQTSPTGKAWNQGRESQSGEIRNQTTGSNVPGSEIADRNRQRDPSMNTGQGYTGNSERSGQQYSIGGNSTQHIDKLNRKENRKDQLDKSHGAGLDHGDRRSSSKGMNAGDMSNERRMDQSKKQRKDLLNVRDIQSDQLDGDE